MRAAKASPETASDDKAKQVKVSNKPVQDLLRLGMSLKHTVHEAFKFNTSVGAEATELIRQKVEDMANFIHQHRAGQDRRTARRDSRARAEAKDDASDEDPP